MLKKYCTDTTSFAYYCFPLDQRPETHPLVSKWVPFMMTDSLLLRAALLSCAVHLENLQGRRDSLNAGLLRMSTITLLRERIQDQELSISDQSIGAVLTLAGVEVRKPLLQCNKLTDSLSSSKLVTLNTGMCTFKGSGEW
jgi:hypothetical protein